MSEILGYFVIAGVIMAIIGAVFAILLAFSIQQAQKSDNNRISALATDFAGVKLSIEHVDLEYIKKLQGMINAIGADAEKQGNSIDTLNEKLVSFMNRENQRKRDYTKSEKEPEQGTEPAKKLEDLIKSGEAVPLGEEKANNRSIIMVPESQAMGRR